MLTTRLLFFAWFLAAIGLVVAGVVGGSYWDIRRKLEAQIYRHLTEELSPNSSRNGASVPHLVWPAVGPADIGRLASRGFSVRYFDLAGVRRLAGGGDAGLPAERPEKIRQLLGQRSGSLRYTSSLRRETWQMWALPVHSDRGDWVGILEVGTSLRHHHQVLEILGRTLLWGGGLGVVVSALMAAWLSQYFGRPIESMARVMNRVRDGELSARTQPGGTAEMRQMAVDLNRMVGELEKLLASQRTFIANASHELKTPLTSLSAMCELLHRRDDELTVERRERAWRVVEREIASMSALVQDLLALSRLEMTVSPGAGFDPLPLLADLAEHYHDVGRVEFCLRGQAIMPGDPGVFSRVVRNLIENALQHTPDPGRVRVSLDFREGLWQLEVDDQGSGIAPEVLDRVAEPFFRGDTSRSRRAGGSGLGLSIVAAWVEQQGGKWKIESGPACKEWSTRIWLGIPSGSLQEHPSPIFSLNP